MSRYRWDVPPPPPEGLFQTDVPRLMAQILYNRGLREPAEVEAFLAADERLLTDPFLLPGMSAAVTRLYQALLSGETIAVYGDYDADGITATAILVQGLSSLGGQAIPYIPHRLREGYGLRLAALESLKQQGVSLVVTADCGITACQEVEGARRLGLDVIITDHHTCLAEIPPALAVVNPKLRGSGCPDSHLTAAGLAFKLVQALFDGMGRGKSPSVFLDLVALGTIADMAPLVGENRYLVKEGLKLVNSSPRPGLREVIAQSGLSAGGVDADRVAWVIAPRLNAAGRMEHALTSYRLLVTESPQEAQSLAARLEALNVERQDLTARFLERAREEVLARGVAPLLFVEGEDYPEGIAGLIAGRLSEEFYRPAVVVRRGRTSSGSARSIPEFNITLALDRCRELLSQFGGHSQAAGFTLPTENLPCLRENLVAIAGGELDGLDLRPHLAVDAELTLADVGRGAFKALQRLAPFGRGNQAPTFLSRSLDVLDCQTMGNNGGHLRLRVKGSGMMWDGVAFRRGESVAEVASPLDIVYNIEVDRWRGEERLRLNILDFAPSQA